MAEHALLPALTETIRQNEIGGGSPYALDFAKKGKSGASFGFMQGDMHVDPHAGGVMGQVLAAAGMAAADVTRIMNALSPALPDGNPLNPADTAAVNAALNSPAGRALVDAMDQHIFQRVISGLDTCIAAAVAKGLAIEPLAQLYIAPWINMTGAPTQMITWLEGETVHGVPPPSPPTVEAHQLVAYLKATSYFQTNPQNFTHYDTCVQKGATLLPQ